jgi:hypothetical protein
VLYKTCGGADMGSVLKSNRYRLVDNNAFDMPLPMKFEVLKKEVPVAEYEISEDESVSYRIVTKYKEDMLTNIRRPIDISDIYYLFSCRVFQDKTPFTLFELSLLGLEKYNVYDILKITRGITPFDSYWIRFEGDNCDYGRALADFNRLTSMPAAPQPAPEGMQAVQSAQNEPTAQAVPSANVGDILNQQKVNVSGIVAEQEAALAEADKIPGVIVPDSQPEETEPLVNNKMSQDDIEALLKSVGLEEESPAPAPTPAPAASSGGGMMSQEEIEKLLAGNSAPAEPEPAPVPEPAPAASSGGKMSQEDIEKLLAGNSAPAEPEPAPEPAPAASSGGKMSQEDIEKLLAGNSAPAEPEPAPAPAPAASSGGKMSQEDIEKLLAGNSAPAEPAPAPEPASAAFSGGKMSQEDIEKLLAGNSAPAEPAPAPEPAPAASSGGKMSQEDIEKLLAGAAAAPAPEPTPAPAPAAPSGGKMSQDDIEALLKSMQDDTSK